MYESLYNQSRPIFRETFNSEYTVRKNGGAPTNVTFSNGRASFGSSNTNIITYKPVVFGKKWTIIGKFKTGSLGAGQNLFMICFSSGVGGRYFYLRYAATFFQVDWNGSPTVNFTNYTILANTEYNFAFTSDGTNLRMYVNGALHSTKAGTATGLNNAYFNKICPYSSNTATRYCDLLEIYTHAKSDSEIQAMYNNSIYKNYNPIMDLNKRIKGTGTYVEKYETTGNAIIPLGQKYFQTSVVPGYISIPSSGSYGTWEFKVLLGTGGVVFLSFKDNHVTGSSSIGYTFGLRNDGTNGLQLAVRNYPSAPTIIYQSSGTYISVNTTYGIKITRTITGVWTIYIKGGSFGNNYILASSIGGSGSNPVTNNTYSFKFLGVDISISSASYISDIRFKPYI